VEKASSASASQRSAEEQKALKIQTIQAHADLRYAARLDRKRKAKHNFTGCDLERLRDFDSGVLRRRVNELTVQSGHGDVRYADGTRIHLGAPHGGLTRRILDGYVPPDPSTLKLD